LTSNRFFIKQSNIRSSYVFLDGEEHHHLSRVARIKPGEKVWLFDERGTNYLARVEEVTKEKTRLAILERRVTPEPRVEITLAQALIKSKKMNSIIQKATELGVTTIIPVITARTVVRIEERAEKKLERWQKIIKAAAKQSKISFLPSISSPVTLEKLVEERDEAKKLVLSENTSSAIILVGPEGGWTSEEEEYILDHAYEAVSLGRQVLRAETAALASLAMISHFWNS